MILFFIGLLSGVISGMGIGGGVILIPSLVLFANVNQVEAQGINLIVFIPIAVVALITHYKAGNIESKFGKKIIYGGVLGAIIGSFIALRIDPNKLRKYFGFFLIAISFYEFFGKKK